VRVEGKFFGRFEIKGITSLSHFGMKIKINRAEISEVVGIYSNLCMILFL